MSRPGSGGGRGGHQTVSHTETESSSDIEIPACFALECSNGTECIQYKRTFFENNGLV